MVIQLMQRAYEQQVQILLTLEIHLQMLLIMILERVVGEMTTLFLLYLNMIFEQGKKKELLHTVYIEALSNLDDGIHGNIHLKTGLLNDQIMEQVGR